MKEKRTCGSHLKKKKEYEKKNERKERQTGDRRCVQGEFLFFSFIFFTFFSDSRKSDRRISSGKERKVFYATRATRGYQKHRISPRIQVKILKILNFWFFSDLRRSNGQNFSDQN